MKIEKLTDNKIRIYLDMKDLANNNIDFQSFMSDQIESQNIFFNILMQAEKEVGFKTKNCKLLIEEVVTSQGIFMLTITKVSDEENNANVSPKKAIELNRKYKPVSCKELIVEFSNFDCFYDYCTSLPINTMKLINNEVKSSKLYYLNSKYYLLVNYFNNKQDFINIFNSSISEFAKIIKNSNTYKNILIEHGALVIKKNAIYECNNKFRSTFQK